MATGYIQGAHFQTRVASCLGALATAHQHLNPAVRNPLQFFFKSSPLTPKNKKPLVLGNQQLKSRTLRPLPFPTPSSADTTCPFSCPSEAGSDLRTLLPQPSVPELSPWQHPSLLGQHSPSPLPRADGAVTLQRYSPHTPLVPRAIRIPW